MKHCKLCGIKIDTLSDICKGCKKYLNSELSQYNSYLIEKRKKIVDEYEKEEKAYPSLILKKEFKKTVCPCGKSFYKRKINKNKVYCTDCEDILNKLEEYKNLNKRVLYQEIYYKIRKIKSIIPVDIITPLTEGVNIDGFTFPAYFENC
jgi:hypothetical protein